VASRSSLASHFGFKRLSAPTAPIDSSVTSGTSTDIAWLVGDWHRIPAEWIDSFYRTLDSVRMAKRKARPSVKDDLVALKRERILDTATRLISERGYHGTSMELLAEALGVTKPFVYYQFRDKAELLTEICGRGADLTLEAAKSARRMPGGTAEHFRSFCEKLAEIVIRHGMYLFVYLREGANLSPQARRSIAGKRAEIDTIVASMIVDGVSEGVFQCDDPLLHARAVTGMISFVHQWYRERNADESARIARDIASIALRTLKKS
jgi:AcrR family transcriptional regulator